MKLDFRVWLAKDEIYFYQCDLFESDEFRVEVTPEGLTLLTLEPKYCSYSGEWVETEEWVEHEDASFEFFTGMLDREENKIYSGDIVGFGDDSPTCNTGLYGELGSVFYDEKDGCWMVELSKSDRDVRLADHNLFSSNKTCRLVHGNVNENADMLAM